MTVNHDSNLQTYEFIREQLHGPRPRPVRVYYDPSDDSKVLILVNFNGMEYGSSVNAEQAADIISRANLASEEQALNYIESNRAPNVRAIMIGVNRGCTRIVY